MDNEKLKEYLNKEITKYEQMMAIAEKEIDHFYWLGRKTSLMKLIATIEDGLL